MPSSYTASLRFEQQFTGENVNTWGVRLNTALGRVDTAIAGRVSITVSGPKTLTTSNTADDEARAAILALNGTGGTLTIPPVSKTYRIENGATGAVVVTTGGGTTVSLDAGDIIDVHCDGTNVKTPGVNGLSYKEYIGSVVIGTISGLPAVTDNEDKFMYTDGVSAYWKLPVVADISDYASDQLAKTAAATALSIAFSIAL